MQLIFLTVVFFIILGRAAANCGGGNDLASCCAITDCSWVLQCDGSNDVCVPTADVSNDCSGKTPETCPDPGPCDTGTNLATCCAITDCSWVLQCDGTNNDCVPTADVSTDCTDKTPETCPGPCDAGTNLATCCAITDCSWVLQCDGTNDDCVPTADVSTECSGKTAETCPVSGSCDAGTNLATCCAITDCSWVIQCDGTNDDCVPTADVSTDCLGKTAETCPATCAGGTNLTSCCDITGCSWVPECDGTTDDCVQTDDVSTACPDKSAETCGGASTVRLTTGLFLLAFFSFAFLI